MKRNLERDEETTNPVESSHDSCGFKAETENGEVFDFTELNPTHVPTRREKKKRSAFSPLRSKSLPGSEDSRWVKNVVHYLLCTKLITYSAER